MIIDKCVIVAFSGVKGSGKTYFANKLVENYNFNKLSFANKLKLFLKDYFNIYDLKNNEELKSKSNNIKVCENKDAFFRYFLLSFSSNFDEIHYNKLLDKNDKEKIINDFRLILLDYYKSNNENDLLNNIRRCYQYFGTEIGRYIDDKIWLYYIDKDIEINNENGNKKIVIDDLRFENEYLFLKNKDEKIFKKLIIMLEVENSERKNEGIDGHKSESEYLMIKKGCDILYKNTFNENNELIDNIINKILMKRVK